MIKRLNFLSQIMSYRANLIFAIIMFITDDGFESVENSNSG